MRPLASATQTSSSIVSSSWVSSADVSSSLTMSENFQNSSVLGTAKSLQLSLPVVSHAASITAGSVCNFASTPAPAANSAWLLPSASGTSFQPLIDSAYPYQHSNTAMLSGVTGQSQISTSAASYPGSLKWDITGSTETKSSSLEDYTVTVIDQDTAVSSTSMAAQYDKTSVAHTVVPLYPSLSATFVQGTPSQIPNQGHSLSLPYQEGSQMYYYNQGTLGHILCGELGPCLQSYGSVLYMGSRASAPQPEIGMVLEEVQPTRVLTPVSTSGTYCSVSAQSITERGVQVMETSLGMETYLGLQPSSKEQAEIKNSEDRKTKLSKPLDDDQIPIENQDLPLLPLAIPDIRQILACIDPPGQKQPPGPDNANLGKNSLSLEDQGTLENGIESSSGFADTTKLVEDTHLPQLLNSLKYLDQSKDLTAIKAKDTGAIKMNQVQDKPSVIKGPSNQVRQNRRKASEHISGAPRAKSQPKNPECLLGGEVVVCSAAASDGAPVNGAKHPDSKPQKAASSRMSKTESHGQEKKRRTRENHTKKAGESKQPGNKVQAEEKPTIPRKKRKENQPDLSQEVFKKPRSRLGMHMLESVQVFHALGRKNDKKAGLSSSRALGNSSNTREPQPARAIKRQLDTPWKGKSPEKTQVKAQKRDGSAEEESPSPSQYELPPPGKVRLIPLPFPTLDRPRPRPAPRRPQSLASHRPAMACSAQPAAANSVNPSQPAPANAALTGPARPAQPIPINTTQPGLTNPRLPSVPQTAAPGPAPDKTSSCTSLQQGPISTAVTKLQSPPKPQTQYPLQDLRYQRIPWRNPNVPEPVMSTPITKEQRPEREAMKKQAQQERENAAKYTSLGKVQYFIEREKEMEIARYY
ncbi:uncharacterized protein C2orf78-like, partial [Cynocephalus volans]|uniref:uncharacterized protein C2orf78-like n=1 Tax=Cynocephalus volans TaxID=110931 RepID=UPI002FCA68EB